MTVVMALQEASYMYIERNIYESVRFVFILQIGIWSNKKKLFLIIWWGFISADKIRIIWVNFSYKKWLNTATLSFSIEF